ncbi:MAG: hypothetical protein FJ096_21995, partial [Deltaproteobacteria bacterium]|nr:hypothetical protein [Deltaproteobacteria bacterium]
EVDGSGGKHYTLEADQFAFAFRGKRAFVGSRARVLHALDPQGHPAPSAGGLAAPADSTVQLYPKVRKDVESETLWAALATTAVLRKQLGMVGSNTLRSVALGITITEGAKLQLRARFEDAAQAARIHSELVSELRAAENDEGLKRMKLVDVVKRTVVKLDGVEIAVGLDLPKAQLEQLRAALLPILFG